MLVEKLENTTYSNFVINTMKAFDYDKFDKNDGYKLFENSINTIINQKGGKINKNKKSKKTHRRM